MDHLVLSTCGPDPIPVDHAVAAVRGYATARRWMFVRTPGHPGGHWVRVPAYRFGVFDAQPADTDAGSLTLSALAAQGLHGVERDQKTRFAFHREVEVLLPLIGRAVQHAAGRPFWELPVNSAAEGPVVDALDAARALTRPDHGSAVLHHHRPELFPLLSRHTARVVEPVASARSGTPWALIRDDLVQNSVHFAKLEAGAAALTGTRVHRTRLLDVLIWLITTGRWAGAVEQGRRP